MKLIKERDEMEIEARICFVSQVFYGKINSCAKWSISVIRNGSCVAYDDKKVNVFHGMKGTDRENGTVKKRTV